MAYWSTSLAKSPGSMRDHVSKNKVDSRKGKQLVGASF